MMGVEDLAGSGDRAMLEIVDMARADLALRDTLASTGALFGRYHPDMAALHRRNAARLREIIAVHGWPSPAREVETAVEAAWLIVQHAIAEPSFQREMLSFLASEAAEGRFPAARVALLEDRVRANEGRLQKYGAQVDWDEHGELSPWPPVEDPVGVDQRRAGVGLPPLAEDLGRLRSEAEAMGARPPADLMAHRAAAAEWARSVGWLP